MCNLPAEILLAKTVPFDGFDQEGDNTAIKSHRGDWMIYRTRETETAVISRLGLSLLWTVFLQYFLQTEVFIAKAVFLQTARIRRSAP